MIKQQQQKHEKPKENETTTQPKNIPKTTNSNSANLYLKYAYSQDSHSNSLLTVNKPVCCTHTHTLS